MPETVRQFLRKEKARLTTGGALSGLLARVLVVALLPQPPQSVRTLASDSSTQDNLHPTQTFRFSPNVDSVVAAFAEQGVEYHPEDEIVTFPDPAMGIGGVITVRRALPVTIIDGKKSYVVRTWESDIKNLLAEKNVELGNDDQLSLAPATTLVAGTSVKITRVAITSVTVSQPIQFSTIKKDDPSMDKGKTRVARAGILGQKQLTYEVRREDGAEVARKLTDTKVVKTAEDELLMVGTKPVITGWCKYNDWVLDAAAKNGADANLLCKGMKIESNGNVNSIGAGKYHGLFQYELGLWVTVSAKAGYAGADWRDAKAQIYTTAWAITHGYKSRWFWAK